MSYFDDFANGYNLISGARERKQDRADKLDQEKLRREFELGRDVERYKQEDSARRAGYDNQTNQRVGGEDFAREQSAGAQAFQAGQATADQGYRTGERVGAQTFQATQSAADRKLREKTLNQAAQQFAKTQDFNYQNMGLMAGLNARKDEALNNPMSLPNQLNNEKLTKLKTENANAAGFNTAGSNPTPKELPIFTPAEAKAAKPGTHYRTQDGRQMIR